MINDLFIKSHLDEIIFFIAINFWYIFLLLAIVFFIIAVKLFKDKSTLKLTITKLDAFFDQIAEAKTMSEFFTTLKPFALYSGVKEAAFYQRRGDIFILQSSLFENDELQIKQRVYKREIQIKEKIGNYYYHYILTTSQDYLMVLVSKKELDEEFFFGFWKMLGAYYEKIAKLENINHLQLVSESSNKVLKNIFNMQYGTETFMKFVISLIGKTIDADGLILVNRDNLVKKIFKKPQEKSVKKEFFIRNTPYTLEVYTKTPLAPQEIEQIGSFLDMAGIYFENMSSNSKIVNNYIHFLRMSNQALEMQSRYFKNHSKKVQLVSLEVGKALFLDEKSLEEISLGAELHDIGMIGKIEHFLDQDKLNTKELDLIRFHPIIGSIIVEPVESIYHIANIIKYHHERFDGTGYPYGLKGSEIPILAQIVALAEYYIGITSPRAYRRALTHKEAVEKIAQLKNKLVDEHIINTFLEIEESIDRKLQVLGSKVL
ncbi:HD-GYP domain-containing protein [Nitratiruptor sp. YY09-18]|uniref:HD-GYP domain-containing protein n=1 Tax=Nitratiruptor sp. YY09-18 TaxID=2724901 RepID=UPI0019158BB9|nr:HD domain-containing phosphohydrolase [Nitratiruptor sp. YY09-18]BCD67688.1 hypothetical protein NitYY0918_C0589 [Nitratiruptor sp. YY09-18]